MSGFVPALVAASAVVLAAALQRQRSVGRRRAELRHLIETAALPPTESEARALLDELVLAEAKRMHDDSRSRRAWSDALAAVTFVGLASYACVVLLGLGRWWATLLALLLTPLLLGGLYGIYDGLRKKPR